MYENTDTVSLENSIDLLKDTDVVEYCELQYYKDLPPPKLPSGVFDPIYWMLHFDIYEYIQGEFSSKAPRLVVQMLAFLCSSAGSSYCERNFNSLKIIASRKRSATAAGTINRKVQLKFNSHLLDKKEVRNKRLKIDGARSGLGINVRKLLKTKKQSLKKRKLFNSQVNSQVDTGCAPSMAANHVDGGFLSTWQGDSDDDFSVAVAVECYDESSDNDNEIDE